MTKFRELEKEFLPETPIEGRRGFYPSMTPEEWRALPLPMKCSTWDSAVEAIIFDTFFSDYGIRGRVEIHPQDVFKALFRHSDKDVLLYSVSEVRWKKEAGGGKSFAKWWQDTTTGAYRISLYNGRSIGTQGGYRGHVPANCEKNAEGKWGLVCGKQNGDGEITHASL